MPRVFTLHPHVLDGLHQPDAEEVLPHPVDLHPGSQRMLRQEQPPGQPQPVGRKVVRQRWQAGWSREGQRIAQRRKIVAPVEHASLSGLGIAHHHQPGYLVAAEVVVGPLGGVILGHHRQALRDRLFHAAVKEASQLTLDRLVVGLRSFGLGLSQQWCQVSWQILAIGRLAVGKQACLPGGISDIDRRLGLSFKPLHFGLQVDQLFALFVTGQFQQRRGHPDAGRLPAWPAALGQLVEDMEQPVVVDLGQRVVLVVMALGAGQRQAQPGGAGGVDAIKQIVEPLLLGNRAPLAVEQMVAVEGRGNFLLVGRVGQQVTSQLFNRELIKRHVGVQRRHHPVPPDPLPGVAILLKAVGVGIAGGIEPGGRHPLAVVGAG